MHYLMEYECKDNKYHIHIVFKTKYNQSILNKKHSEYIDSLPVNDSNKFSK